MRYRRILWILATLSTACGEETTSVEVDAEVRVRRMDMNPPPVPDAAVMDATPVMDMAPPPPDLSINDSNVTPPPDARPPAPDMAVMVDAAPDALPPDMGPPPTCEDIECDAFSICVEDAVEGASCVDQRCRSDRDCAPEEYCNEQCVPDVCVAGGTLCGEDGVTLLRCLENGGGTEPIRVCGEGDPAITSACVELEPGVGRCSCADIWDCPPNYFCERGTCEGTGEPPSCLLPVASFLESLPQQEVVWGGNVITDDANQRLAVAGPWPKSSQSVSIPLVANLDDDNEDGKVNELDFPEIIFMTFCSSGYTSNGVLRAIHGGGPKKGQDYFATHRERTWRAGDPMPEDAGCSGWLDPTTSAAVGDIDDPADSDGRPEIVTVTSGNKMIMYDNEGFHLFTSDFVGDWGRQNATPSLTNLDNRGMAEVVVANDVFVLEYDDLGLPAVQDVFVGGNGSKGLNSQGPISCVADILGGPEMEIIAGGTVYGLPRGPEGATRTADCVQNGGAIEPQTPEEIAYCERRLLVHWDAAAILGQDGAIDGFCAVADVLGGEPQFPPGLDNPLDGRPEVILISGGRLMIFDGETGVRHRNINFVGGNGGPPNVDDFDGDGFPEVGTAGGSYYRVWDLQEPTERCPAWTRALRDDQPVPDDRTPGGPECESDEDCFFESAVCNPVIGQCVCLHNSWLRTTEDDSSSVTGSTLFDFNGDGAAEVVYNDECYFRVYDGRTGEVLFKEASESRTRIEYPIVADADNDGNAEIIFCTTTESGFCSEKNDPHPDGGLLRERYNYGIEMWGDPADRWVPARRIWNQHAYHITHIREDGTIPLQEVKGWQPVNGREFNSYRAQPRTAGIAPDLTVPEVGITSIAGACSALGDHINISVLVGNEGDVRAGPGIRVAFMGQWGDGEWELLVNDMGTPIQAVVQTTIEPGRTARVSAEYRLMGNPAGHEALPDRIRVIVDVGDDPVYGGERECDEENNTAEADVRDPGNLPDLNVDSVDVVPLLCPSIEMTVTFTNIGASPAENPTVAFFAGDPEQGGFRLATTGYAGVVQPGEQVQVTTTTAKLTVGEAVRVYGVVDWTQAIIECDESNNTGRTEGAVLCLVE